MNRDAQSPTSGLELGQRLGEIAKILGSQAKAAEMMKVSLSQFKRYLTGENQPSFESVSHLSYKTGASLDWLGFGKGTPFEVGREPSSSQALQIDEELNARVVDGIARLYKEEGAGLSPMDLGRLAAKVYADLVNTFDDPEERLIGLKATLTQLKRQLHEPPVATDENKRSA